MITGKLGIHFYTNTGTGSALANTGRIITDSDAIASTTVEKIVIINSGTITSNGGYAFNGGAAADTLTNKGTINSSLTAASGIVVDLRGDNDVYEGNGGKINGTVYGNDGQDELRGGAFTDRLSGGANNDILLGRGGRDALEGGPGNDTFDYNSILDSGSAPTSRDLIRDFTAGNALGNDRIDLSTIDANTGLTGNQAFALLAKGTATSAVGTGKIGWYWIDDPINNALDRTILRLNNDADVTIEMQIELVGLKVLSPQAGVDFVF